MKKALLLFVISFSAIAEDFNFTYFGNEGRSRIFLSCDYAEASTERIFEKLGLENVEVTCTGGLSQIGFWPVMIRAKFDFPEEGGEFKVKNDRFLRTNCFFDTRLVRELRRKFKKNVEFTKSRSFCFDSESTYFFDVTIK